MVSTLGCSNGRVAIVGRIRLPLSPRGPSGYRTFVVVLIGNGSFSSRDNHPTEDGIRNLTWCQALAAVTMGSVAATAGTRSAGMELPAVTMLPVLGSKLNMRSNLSVQGV